MREYRLDPPETTHYDYAVDAQQRINTILSELNELWADVDETGNTNIFVEWLGLIEQGANSAKEFIDDVVANYGYD